MDYLVVHSCFFGRFVKDQEKGGGAGLSIAPVGWMDCCLVVLTEQLLLRTVFVRDQEKGDGSVWVLDSS